MGSQRPSPVREKVRETEVQESQAGEGLKYSQTCLRGGTPWPPQGSSWGSSGEGGCRHGYVCLRTPASLCMYRMSLNIWAHVAHMCDPRHPSMCVSLDMCTHTCLENERTLCAAPSDHHYLVLPALAQKELEGRQPAFSEHHYVPGLLTHILLFNPYSVPLGEVVARELGPLPYPQLVAGAPGVTPGPDLQGPGAATGAVDWRQVRVAGCRPSPPCLLPSRGQRTAASARPYVCPGPVPSPAPLRDSLIRDSAGATSQLVSR